LFFGFVMNELMPQQWFGMSNMNHALHNHEEMVTGWMQVVSSIVLILLIINAFRLRYWPIAKKSNHNTLTLNKGMETKTVAVLGMTCNHCKMNVENNLRKLPGIKDITVDLQSEQAVITADKVNLELIKSTVEGLGYKYGGEKQL